VYYGADHLPLVPIEGRAAEHQDAVQGAVGQQRAGIESDFSQMHHLMVRGRTGHARLRCDCPTPILATRA